MEMSRDAPVLPDGTTRTSSEERSHIATSRISSKEDMESAQPIPKLEETSQASPQFPEGGLQAWLTVVGGYVHSSG
jgi:hypothetical protein